MQDRVTCFKLNWYNCGLCCVEEIVQEEITVYRNENLLVYKELNGYGVICSCDIIHINKDSAKEFFEFLEKNYNEWESDYKVDVCDGSEWIVRMWHSSQKIKKVCGTTAYPSNGKRIEKFINTFIIDGKSLINKTYASLFFSLILSVLCRSSVIDFFENLYKIVIIIIAYIASYFLYRKICLRQKFCGFFASLSCNIFIYS